MNQEFFFNLKCFELILFIFIMSMLLGRFSQANCKNHITLLNINCVSITVEWWEYAQCWDRALPLKYAVLGSFIQIACEWQYGNHTDPHPDTAALTFVVTHLLGPPLPHKPFFKIQRTSAHHPGLWNGYRKDHPICLPNSRWKVL